jgi:hypothetical protein
LLGVVVSVVDLLECCLVFVSEVSHLSGVLIVVVYTVRFCIHFFGICVLTSFWSILRFIEWRMAVSRKIEISGLNHKAYILDNLLTSCLD